jgi:15-cis-phytoene synthase
MQMTPARPAAVQAMSARPESPATRALAWLYCGEELRPLFSVLCAIEQEIRASLRAGIEHPVAHARLAWWTEEGARCAQGAPVHPLTRELARLPDSGPALAALAGLTGIAAWDLAGATFESRRELREYCARWSAALIEPLAVRAQPAAARQVHCLGCALHELELLVTLGSDAREGRLRLPLDELADAGVDPAELATPGCGAALARLLIERHRELRAALRTSIDALAPPLQSQLRGVIVWAALASQRSLRAQSQLPHSLLVRDARFTDGWHAWRAARSAQAGRGMGSAPGV